MTTDALKELIREVERHAVLRAHGKLTLKARAELMDITLLSELEVAARKWRSGIEANRSKWTVKNVKSIQAAGDEMFRLMDELEALRNQRKDGYTYE